MTPDETSIAELRSLAIFDGLPDPVLAWFLERGSVTAWSPGERLFEPGAPADRMFVVLDGELDVLVPRNDRMESVMTVSRGAVTGLLPYSRLTAFPGTAIPMQPTRLLTVARDDFPAMLALSPDLTARLVARLSDRVRESAQRAEQRDKLMALGKLSAGLAHELNNPAAAVARAAHALEARLVSLSASTTAVAAHALTLAQLQALDGLRRALLEARAGDALSPIERGRREDAVADWLEARKVGQPWVLAETFVAAGVTSDDLEAGLATLPSDVLPEVLVWLEATLAAEGILGEILSASGRISELVASIKAYSHMDRTPERQPTDVRDGLESTLVMLGHQIKRKQAAIDRTYADDLPSVAGYPGALNQVWTNLLDNAIDALPETGGHIRIEAVRDRDAVAVRIIDNGSGIPDDRHARIFEPFYTTKAIGVGTGLGLDIVQRIVTQHGGRVTVESRPGRTAFTVRLPLDPDIVSGPRRT